MNRRFQEYKKCKVVLVEDLDLGIEVKFSDFVVEDERSKDERPKEKYNRAKENREFRRRIDEEWDIE